MHLIGGVVLLCVLVSSTHAGWLKDLISPRGLDMGSGFTLHLDNIKRKNATLLERHAVRLDYAGLGVSVGKSPRKEAVEVGFFINDKVEGRDKKFGEVNLPMLIGFKFASVATFTLTVMTALVVKALGVAKLALITSAVLLISKLIHHEPTHNHHRPAYVEIEQASESHPVLAEYPPSGGGYHPSGTANYYAYSNYAPSAVAEGAINYATVEASPGNTTVAGGNQQVAVLGAAGKRRDFSRRKYKLPILMVHRYSVDA